MSPRSEELLLQARRWLASAGSSLGSGFPESAATDAYYAVFYAARAALSEEDRYAKTHGGVWDLLHRLFVTTGRLDEGLYGRARRIERLRLDAHYEARDVPSPQAEQAVHAAEQFIKAIEGTINSMDREEQN